LASGTLCPRLNQARTPTCTSHPTATSSAHRLADLRTAIPASVGWVTLALSRRAAAKPPGVVSPDLVSRRAKADASRDRRAGPGLGPGRRMGNDDDAHAEGCRMRVPSDWPFNL
jgi:hypothetical protein